MRVADLSRWPREREDVAMIRVELEPVDRVEITILIDNVTDPLLVDQDAVTRINWPKALMGALPTAPARVCPGSGVPDALIAEPGSRRSCASRRPGASERCCSTPACRRAGWSRTCAGSGSRRRDVEVIVLSHGHWDHVTGMEGLVKALGRTQLPVMIHPEFWNRRRIRFPGLDPAELPATSRSALEEMGFAIVEERQPSFLLDGAVLITGEVDRTTAFETGFQGHEAMRDGGWQPDPLILDDQALIVSLGDRGLVVLSGCGHAGIVNTVRYARKLTGKRRRRGDRRRLSPQRPDVRADHRAHRRCARRALTLAAGARPLHRLEGGPSARSALPRRVRHEHGRHHDHALIRPPASQPRWPQVRSLGAPGPQSPLLDDLELMRHS